MTANTFLFGNEGNKKDMELLQNKLFDHINKYLHVQKKYPGRRYLASYIGVNENEIKKMLDNLVKENKLAKKDDSYYIPGLETYEALQKESTKKFDKREEKPVIFIDDKIKEKIIDRPGLEDEKLPELTKEAEAVLNGKIEEKQVIIKADEIKEKPFVIMQEPGKIEMQQKEIPILPLEETLQQKILNAADKIAKDINSIDLPFLKTKKVKTQKKPVTFAGVRISQLFVIKVILVLMLITSVMIEMSYNIENFVLMMGPVKGTLTGTALVIYDCIAISLIIYVLKMKIFYKGDKIFKVLKTIITKGFITALLICLFLGVFYILQVNIMQGLFDKFQDQLFAKKTQVENKSLILLNRYEKEEKELEAELSIRITNRDKLQAVLQTIEDIDSKEYKNTNYRLAVANNDIDKHRVYLQKRRSEIDTIYKENNTVVLQEKLNFFDLVSINVFKNAVKSNWLQIVQVFFPALIFNLISSAAMGLILFLKE